MRSRSQAWLSGALIVSAALIALFVLISFAGAPSAGATSAAGAAAQKGDHRTPEATETEHHGTPHPEGTRTPHEDRTPEVSRTPHPERTPEGTRTPHEDRTRTPEAEHSRTPHPEGTRTPHEDRTPQGTRTPHEDRTPHPEGTRTAHPEGTRTPQATRTPGGDNERHLLRLSPSVRIEHTQAGASGDYHFTLRSSETSTVAVDFEAASLSGWDSSITPGSASVAPGASVDATVHVSVPVSPSNPIDVVVVTASDGAHTAHAGVVLVLRQQDFADMSSTHWANSSVQYLAAQGVVSGYADGTFRPNNTVTRAQFAKMLVSGMGWQVVTPATPHFSDVSANFWAYGFIETAVAHGALSGYSDGSFHPSAEITRAQLAKMIVVSRNWAQINPSAGHFSDVSSANWAYGFVETAVDAGVLSGYEDGSFHPNSPATRAQVAKILANGLVASQDQ